MNAEQKNRALAKPIATKATTEEAERAILDILEANMITAPVYLPKPGTFVGISPKEGAKGRTVTVYNMWGAYWIVNAHHSVEPSFPNI